MAPMANYRAQVAVRAVMAWPDPADEQARNEYIATLMSMHLADLKATRSTLPDPHTAESWEERVDAIEQHEELTAAQTAFEEWFDEVGGHASVSRAPGFRAFQKDFATRLGDWFAAGLVLALVRRMAAHHADLPGGASVNKAVYIIEKAKPPGVTSNRSALYNAWKMYKPVAHFCAVMFDWFMIAYENKQTPKQVAAAIDSELNDNFLMFLSEAEAYLEFGLTYRLQRAKAQTLLDPVETWVLPKHRFWPDLPYRPTPLSGPLLEAAKEYRAPIQGV